MSCNCNRNRSAAGCGCNRAQHIRVNQTSATMVNGPYCNRAGNRYCQCRCCCQRCCCCGGEEERPRVDYACLRRAMRNFENQVARCMGLCGLDESEIVYGNDTEAASCNQPYQSNR